MITGAGKGLGRAYALHCAGLGACVVVNNRRHAGEQRSSADQTADDIRRQGGRAVAEYSSVETTQSGDNLLKCALDAFGRVDALIANAGVTEGVAFRRVRVEIARLPPRRGHDSVLVTGCRECHRRCRGVKAQFRC